MLIENWKKYLSYIVCAVAFWVALPNFMSQNIQDKYADYLPKQRLNLGLDLQGGAHLLLQVDMASYLSEQTEKLRQAIRLELRAKNVGYTKLAVEDGVVQLVVRRETLAEGAGVRAILRQVSNEIDVAELEENSWQIKYSDAAIDARKKQLLAQTIEIIARRIDELGTREPTIQSQGEGRILLQVAGLNDPAQLKTILGTTAKMGFHLVNHSVSQSDLLQDNVPLDSMILQNEESGDSFAVYASEALGGDALVDAHVAVQENQPVVAFRFDTAGARKFAEITKNNIGKQFAVVLDGKIITAPVIRSAILGGSGIIEGDFTAQSAENLALLLRAGALPADVSIVEERTVGASLGADSIKAGEKACIIALILVMVFMLVAYGLFGIFANIALVANLVILLASLSLLQATLTLPGIAGIVLTLGMAVDANVLIFERIREEFLGGNSLKMAISKGFDGAFMTILDSNITTLASALVLFIFGSGTIKGFAVTLSVGILASMFSAILLTRIMLSCWLQRKVRTTLPI